MQHYFGRLNVDQKEVYDAAIKAVEANEGGIFFVYGHGGTRKTYVYSAIIFRLRFEGKIVLTVASSGIDSLLLPGGRTIHSRFGIPINPLENATCDIRKGTQLAELIALTSLIIWDEASMSYRHNSEAVNRLFNDILTTNGHDAGEKPFGGKIILLGADFKQILPVVKKGKKQDIVSAMINKAVLWDYCQLFIFTKNMRVNEASNNIELSKKLATFNKWALDIRNGDAPTVAKQEEGEPSWTRILEEFLITASDNLIKQIIKSTYPSFEDNMENTDYLKERAILSPTNEIVDEINEEMIQLVARNKKAYLSYDSICKASSNTSD